MLKNNLEQLAIKKAVLKAVRKLSGFAFSGKLGDFSLNFELNNKMKWIDISPRNEIGKFVECFKCDFLGTGNNTYTIVKLPKLISEIPRFEAEVEAAIAQVNKFIQSGDKS